MDQAAIRGQILRYYSGELTGAQQQALLHSLELVSTTELEMLYPYSEWVETEVATLSETTIEAALQKHRQLRTKEIMQPAKIRRLSLPLKVACAAVVLIALGLLFVYITDKHNQVSLAASYKTIHINNGKQSRITLPDGSVITAGGGTTLRIPEVFTDKLREVFIEEGEAFFDIRQNPQQPFIVRSSRLDVQVLGTSFSVRDYKDESKTSVSVRTGKVAVNHPDKKENTVYLTQGLRTEMDNIGQFYQTQIDTLHAFGWLDGVYVFRSATLKEIISQLRHGYAVDFIVSNPSLLNKRFSATFRKNTIAEIMEQLKLMSNIRYTIKSNTVIIQ